MKEHIAMPCGHNALRAFACFARAERMVALYFFLRSALMVKPSALRAGVLRTRRAHGGFVLPFTLGYWPPSPSPHFFSFSSSPTNLDEAIKIIDSKGDRIGSVLCSIFYG